MRLASITRVWLKPTVLHPSFFFFISLSLSLLHTLFGALGSFFSFFLTSCFSFFCFLSFLSFFCLSYTHICVNMYRQLHMHIHICMHTQLYAYMGEYVQTYTLICIFTYACTQRITCRSHEISELFPKKCFQCSPKRRGLLDFGGRGGKG